MSQTCWARGGRAAHARGRETGGEGESDGEVLNSARRSKIRGQEPEPGFSRPCEPGRVSGRAAARAPNYTWSSDGHCNQRHQLGVGCMRMVARTHVDTNTGSRAASAMRS